MGENDAIESNLSTEIGDETIIKKEGDATGNWYDSFGEGHADHFKGFESADKFVEDLVSVKGKIPVIPETTEGYTFEKPEDHPYEVNKDALQAFAAKAHEMKMTPEQFKSVVAYQLSLDKEAHGNAVAQLKKDEDGLKAEWGTEFKGRLDKSVLVMNHLFGDDFKNVIKTMNLGDNPAFVKGMYKLSTMISEDKFVPSTHKEDPKPKNIDTQTGKRMLSFPSMEKD